MNWSQNCIIIIIEENTQGGYERTVHDTAHGRTEDRGGSNMMTTLTDIPLGKTTTTN
jgi:hypothetical protein